jgi:hypothetical protein
LVAEDWPMAAPVAPLRAVGLIVAVTTPPALAAKLTTAAPALTGVVAAPLPAPPPIEAPMRLDASPDLPDAT